MLKILLVYQLFHTFYTQVIFGCTRHSSNKFGSALVCMKILRSTILKQAFIVLTYRKCWHVANPILPGRRLKVTFLVVVVLAHLAPGLVAVHDGVFLQRNFLQ